MEDNSTKILDTNKEYVRYNSLFVRAIIPLIPKKDREFAFDWLKKLSRSDGTPFQMKNRAEYLWYFIMNAVQSQEILPPFNTAPPTGELPPLGSVLPKEIYGDVADCVERKRWWKEEPLVEGLHEEELQEDDQSWNLIPSEFVSAQPIPRSDGTYLYACVFAPRRD